MILLVATLCLPLLLLVAARRARAEAPRVDGVLPCSAAQLRRALSLRLPRGQRAKLASVRVRALGARNALIQLRGKQRVVPLLGLRGAAAARRLALGVLDLLRAPARRRPAAARWGARGVAAPLVLTLALQGLPAGATPGRAARLTELAAELKRFKQAARGYRQTVHRIVRRSYTHRRRAMLSGNARNLGLKEAEERLRRLAAITLFEGFLRRYPNDRRWTPDVIFRLAELYFEKANDATCWPRRATTQR